MIWISMKSFKLPKNNLPSLRALYQISAQHKPHWNDHAPAVILNPSVILAYLPFEMPIVQLNCKKAKETEKDKLGDRWESLDFPVPSLSCFIAEGLALSRLSILG